MTEEEYLACADYRPVLALHGKVTSGRTWRLFAIACCRSIWHLMTEDARLLVETAERFLDRELSDRQREAARRPDVDFLRDPPFSLAAHFCAEPTARIKTVARNDVPVKCIAAVSLEEGKAARAACIARIAALVREVFGNPYRPSAELAPFLSPEVQSLAQATYQDRTLPSGELALDRLAVLADALEEAGCSDEPLLDHLRSARPHPRGCWALERILASS